MLEKKNFIELVDRCYAFLQSEVQRYENSEDRKNYDAYAFNHLFMALNGAFQDIQIAYMESDDYLINKHIDTCLDENFVDIKNM